MTRYAPSRYVHRRRARRTSALLLSAAAALALLGISLAALSAAAPRDARAAEPVTSTPRAEWRRGEVPCLYQTDPAWAGIGYAGGTIEKNGCGPTCLSMVYVALTGKDDLDPAGMAALSERGGYTADGMTTWTLMSEGASELGLRSEELPASADAVREALSQGHPVICSVLPGDFTSTGHFIVLAGLTEEGEIVVRDPNSAERTGRTWELDRVLAQCANLWSFSA